MIGNNECGILVPPNHPEQLAQAIQTLEGSIRLVEGAAEFKVEPLEAGLRQLAEALGLTAAQLFSLLRLAATGQAVSPPLVETLIALSIVYMALENVVGSSAHRRWIIAFAFGLVHGFGFAFGLRETLQFAGSHLVTSLVAFNVGVELGQVAVLAVLVPALNLLFRAVPERAGILILSALVAHTGWHWMTDRWADLRKFPLPDLDAASAAAGMRWLMAAIVLAGLVWIADRWLAKWLGREAPSKPSVSRPPTWTASSTGAAPPPSPRPWSSPASCAT